MSIPSLPNTQSNSQTPILLLSNISNYVTIKLDHTNYLMWKFQITGILDAYSLLDHLEDSTPSPPKFLLDEIGCITSEANPLFLQWKTRDKALFSLISSTLSPSAISLVMGQTSASGIWRVIKNRYTSISRSSVVNLKRELNNIKKGNDSVTSFLQKIKETRDKLTSVGIHIDDEEILHIVLQGLPSDFHSFTSAMLTKNEPVLFEKLHILMKTEEDLLKSSMDNTKEISHMAMAATASSQSSWVGNRGRGTNRGRGNRGGRFQSYNRGGFNQGGFSQGNSNNGGGATDHFTPDLNTIPDNHAYTDSQLVSVGNGQQLPISNIGNGQLRTSSSLFHLPRRFQITDLLTAKPLYTGFSKDGLYPIHGLSLPSWNSRISALLSRSASSSPSSHTSKACLSSVCSNVSQAALWHTRLGHPQSRAPRAWFERFTSHLLTLGFIASVADTSLFILRRGSLTVYLLLYVDDIIITGNDSSVITSIISQLSTTFELKDLGLLRYFLGLQIDYTKSGFFVHQRKYLTDLLTKFHMIDSKAAPTPIVLTLAFTPSDDDVLPDPTPYRSLVGALQYATFTRPDITFAVNRVCQFMHKPTSTHFVAAKRILRFLKGTLDKGILFQPGPLTLTAFTDADWAGDPSDRRSTSGITVFLGHNPITWVSKKQHTVSRSSTEAEYRSLAAGAAELAWLRQVLCDLGLYLASAPVIWCDNTSALALASNPVFHGRTKHIEVDYHFVREKVVRGDFSVQFISIDDQIADIFTKALPSPRFHRLSSKLLVCSTDHLFEGG
uniref:Reverse transcriptase Ty1/copia-type domain-containing protein n=1 Tax=Fagus sylvatica TaxID=28930 RepID=A0A2N9E1A3_FAGSY